jgi:PAS domain-containing protein
MRRDGGGRPDREAAYHAWRRRPAGMADIIEQVLNAAAREQEEAEHQLLGEVQANASERLTQLLSASPAVIYSFKASGNFAPTFVSTNIETLFGYAPCEYLDNPKPEFLARACPSRRSSARGDRGHGPVQERQARARIPLPP